MPGVVLSFRAQAEVQAGELLRAIDAAESVIVSTIERECEALRAGRLLAANALRLRLRDAAKLYLNVTRAARASIWTIEQLLPGTEHNLEQSRKAFAALRGVSRDHVAAVRDDLPAALHNDSGAVSVDCGIAHADRRIRPAGADRGTGVV